MPTLFVTLLGGMQEPGHGAANTLVGLLENEEQMAKVRSDMKAWLPKAVTEGTRWVAPIGTQGREATQDVEIGGVMIPAGSAVSAVIASANHDEEVFKNPGQFDITREARSTATFGFGPHFCAGRWMSQAQMEIALRELLVSFPNMRLDRKKPYDFFGWEFRAPTSLWVNLRS